MCNVPLHNLPIKGENAGRACSINYHDEMCFGLGFKDSKELHSKIGVKWREPSKASVKRNRKHIESITADL